jgi:hypothetical protein
MKPFRALAIAFRTIGELPFWPGDRVRPYGGPSATYLRQYHGFHLIAVDDGCPEQLAPYESLRKTG